MVFFNVFLSFYARAFPKSTGSAMGHTRVQCVIYFPTLRDSNVTTGNYTLFRVKTVVPGGEKDLTIVSYS